MAHNLIWADVSAEVMLSIHSPHPKKGVSAKGILAKAMGLTDLTQPRHAILLDLYVHALQFGQSLQLTDDKLSGLVSILKATHSRATDQRLPIERAFTLFKDLLLQHSVQRPPHSVGLFSLSEFKAILDWGLDTYFRHYKLYQYSFTDRVEMSVQQTHPSEGVETAPQLPPLQAAITQDQHQALQQQEQQQRATEAAAAAEAAAAVAEKERQARLRAEYEAAIPDEIKDQVAVAVEREMAVLRAAMEAQFQAQQEELLAKLGQLEARASVQ